MIYFVKNIAKLTFDLILSNNLDHQGLRLILGAFRTSSVESLYSEAHEAPLSLRRQKLAMQYFIKIISCPTNPAFHCIVHPLYKPLFDRKENAIKPFGFRIQDAILESQINPDQIHESIYS